MSISCGMLIKIPLHLISHACIAAQDTHSLQHDVFWGLLVLALIICSGVYFSVSLAWGSSISQRCSTLVAARGSGSCYIK